VPRPEIITPNETANQWNNRTFLASMTKDQDFPGKASHCNMFFFLSHSVEFNSGWRCNIMGKDAKGKGKGKTRNKKV